jgi:hypothetical protein
VRSRRGWLVVAAAFVLVATVVIVVIVRRPEPGDVIPPPPAARDEQAWPFAWDSIWNLPRGEDAALVDAGIDPAGYVVSADEDIVILDPDAPRTDVLVNDAGWDGSRTRCGSVQPGEVLVEDLPIPADFSTDPGYLGATPNMAAAIQVDETTVVQTQPFHVCGEGGPATSQFLFPEADLRDGDGRLGAHGGSGMSSLGGTIRVGELAPGSAIRHALKINVDCSQVCWFDPDEADGQPGYRWPADAADSHAPDLYGGSQPAMQMGSLLALPADFDVSSLRTPPARILARALRDYGAYVVDDTQFPTVAFTTEWGPAGRVVEQFEADWGYPLASETPVGCGDEADGCRFVNDLGRVIAALRVVDDNGPDRIGGAGARLTTCAPPFTDGDGGAPASCSPYRPT